MPLIFFLVVTFEYADDKQMSSFYLQPFQFQMLPHRLSLFTYGQSCIRIILLVPSGSQTPICYALHAFVLHLAPAVSVLQLLKSGTLSLRLFECVPAMILSAINSRPTTSSWLSNPLSASSLAPQIQLWLTIVHVYKLYLLTYLLKCSFFLNYVDNDFTGVRTTWTSRLATEGHREHVHLVRKLGDARGRVQLQ